MAKNKNTKKNSPKLRTEAELKEALWQYALGHTEDDELGFGKYETEGEKLRKEIDRFAVKEIVSVSGFIASKKDISKIRNEVENSCLTKAAKDSLLSALKAAKVA